MFRRKQPAPEQRPRQMQITDLKRMHPSVIAHPDGKSFDLPVHTATTRFLLLIRLPDEFPVVPPNITVSVVGISHRLLQDSTVINPQLTSGWDPQTPLGGLIQNIVNEFVNNPPSILAEMASNRPPQQPSQQEQPSNKDAMHPSAIALPPIPQEIEELKRLSPEQVAKIVTDEVALEDFVQKLPLWSAILSLRQGIEQEVTKVANENLEEEKRVEQLREEIGALQSEIREQLAVWETVHQRQQKILLQSSPVSVSRLLQEKADRIDISCENLHDQYVTGSIPEDDFIKQYRQQRSQYHRLMVYSERLLN